MRKIFALFLVLLLVGCSDNEPPIIELIGDDTIIVELDTVYEELGVSIVDDSEEEIVPEITSNIDVNSEGVYRVDYVATDSSGNTSNATRVVIVEDTLDQVTFKDAYGNIVSQSIYKKGELPEVDLPKNDEKWIYNSWEPEVIPVNGDIEYISVQEPNPNYFVGNIFQIVVYNLGEIPVSTGTGTIINEYGWFITNDHVMDDGYFAKAFFDIPDKTLGQSHTSLDIELAAFSDSNKDIFIGKIPDYYSKVGKNYYKEIDFVEEYETGDITYSVGYPNSSVDLMLNKGIIQEDVSSIYDKVYGGVTYIGSTSFIAPGSSGGVLVNDDLEIIGITTIGISDSYDDFLLGGAVETFNFSNNIRNLGSYNTYDYYLFNHEDEVDYIQMFLELQTFSNYEKVEFDNYTTYMYTLDEEGTNSDGVDYIIEGFLAFDSDMYISYYQDFYWSGGDRRITEFYGYYNPYEGLDNMTFDFYYEWEDGEYYTLTSTNINYSSNLDLTLNDHSTTSSFDIVVTSGNVDYAKNRFNSLYEWIQSYFD